ncbi:hypothetical protein ACFQY5_33410 [Paeniroseomonas aquatica]|uniref:hypothetical protein n=1 Tax=Paeniroseomonas aquatica TaxID=373043 RepID=UPI00361FD641
MSDQVDVVRNEQGQAIGGSGRTYTDEAELGDYVLNQFQLGDTVDWNATAERVLANYAETGEWFFS